MAFRVAEVWVTDDAALVTTVGRAGVGVLSVSSAAFAVPPGVGGGDPEVVGGVRVRAVTDADTATGLVPDPGERTSTARLPVGGRGAVFELAFADFPAVGVHGRVQGRRVWVIDDAASVTTVGGFGASVLNVSSRLRSCRRGWWRRS